MGLNTSNYMNPELDTLIDRYLVTIPHPDRMQLVGQIVHLMSDQVVPFVLVYDITATAIGPRLRNVSDQGNEMWNVAAWDVG